MGEKWPFHFHAPRKTKKAAFKCHNDSTTITGREIRRLKRMFRWLKAGVEIEIDFTARKPRKE